MTGWVGLVGWPVADGLPTLVVTHQLQVERRTGKVRRPETDVLPLCHATNYGGVSMNIWVADVIGTHLVQRKHTMSYCCGFLLQLYAARQYEL